MPDYVVSRVGDALNTVKKPINGSRVHLFGIAYKKDVNDVRESPALDIITLLKQRGAIVTYTDPYIPEVDEHGHRLTSVPADAAFANGCDCAVLTTDHQVFDYDRLATLPLIVDTRNALKGYSGSNIVRL
jgi:UDP-N-acetyl-D-glucosamine dehydrogenase